MTTPRLVVTRADITTLTVDAIVNAANETLLGGGGVDGAIHRAAGSRLREACRVIGGCRTGQAVMTPGFDLPARHVIHTVGPVWRGGESGEPALLASCHHEALRIARDHGVRTIAFPAISCGVFGYPPAAAADVAIGTAVDWLNQDGTIQRIEFACFDEEVAQAFHAAWEEVAT